MICLHPTKENPTSWRLQDKKLNVQEYFPFKRHGSQKLALAAVKARDKELNKRRLAAKLRSEIDSNLLFDCMGNVKGLSVMVSSKRGVIVKAQATINGKQKSNTRLISNRSPKEAFDELAAWLMKEKGIKSNVHLKHDLKAAYLLFMQRNKHKLSM